MTDAERKHIVNKLRISATGHDGAMRGALLDAADEIERLRAIERMVRQYVDADPQVRGECYRELLNTLAPPQEGKP